MSTFCCLRRCARRLLADLLQHRRLLADLLQHFLLSHCARRLLADLLEHFLLSRFGRFVATLPSLLPLVPRTHDATRTKAG